MIASRAASNEAALFIGKHYSKSLAKRQQSSEPSFLDVKELKVKALRFCKKLKRIEFLLDLTRNENGEEIAWI